MIFVKDQKEAFSLHHTIVWCKRKSYASSCASSIRIHAVHAGILPAANWVQRHLTRPGLYSLESTISKLNIWLKSSGVMWPYWGRPIPVQDKSSTLLHESGKSPTNPTRQIQRPSDSKEDNDKSLLYLRQFEIVLCQFNVTGFIFICYGFNAAMNWIANIEMKSAAQLLKGKKD